MKKDSKFGLVIGLVALAAVLSVYALNVGRVRVPAQVGRTLSPGERCYVVTVGDSVSNIAVRFYGSSRFRDLIVRRNRLSAEAILRVGDTLVIPPAPAGTGSTGALGETRGVN